MLAAPFGLEFVKTETFPLTLFIGFILWNSRAAAYRIASFNQSVINDKRTGGFPNFPQSFAMSNAGNKFFHGFYFPQQNAENVHSNRNACGTRSVNFTPKRAGKIIGGKLDIVLRFTLVHFDQISCILPRSYRSLWFFSMASGNSNFQLRERHFRASLWCGGHRRSDCDDSCPLHRGNPVQAYPKSRNGVNNALILFCVGVTTALLAFGDR